MADYMLTTEKLSISFGGLKAVQDMNLQVKKNEIYGLIGPNGAGKTTVFNLLTGVYAPTAGTFYLDGKELRGLNQEQVNHAGIARTYQNIRLFNNMTVVRNVMVGLANLPEYACGLFTSIFRLPRHFAVEKTMRERAKELLRIFGLEEERNNLACNLPYGKQRKLEIARALATEPAVILADEPTAELDSGMATEVTRLFKQISEEEHVTIIMTTHDVGLMGAGDQLIELKNGRIEGSDGD